MKWQIWFAWYPVAFGPHIAWMKYVQRRRDLDDGSWIYRRDIFPLDSPSYHFRNLPCSVVQDEDLWYVAGHLYKNNEITMSGILEWCTSKEDADAVWRRMVNSGTDFRNLYFAKFLAND